MSTLINEVELASNLAEQATKDYFLVQAESSYFSNEEDLVMPDPDDPDTTIWKPECQKIYDTNYDYFYDEILKCKEE